MEKKTTLIKLDADTGSHAISLPKRHRTPKQTRSEETRRTILQKAREAFAEYGFAGVNIRDIAREAGVTHSMITYHFGGKEQLWREAVRDMFEMLDRDVFGLQWVEEHLPLKEQFVRMIRRYVQYSARHPEHARITLTETIQGGERLEWMTREFVGPSHKLGMPWVKRLMDEGIVRRIPIESYIYALAGMVQLPFALAKEAQIAFDHDFLKNDAIVRHADAVLTLLLNDPD